MKAKGKKAEKDFTETQHPRGEDGKFVAKSEGGGSRKARMAAGLASIKSATAKIAKANPKKKKEESSDAVRQAKKVKPTASVKPEPAKKLSAKRQSRLVGALERERAQKAAQKAAPKTTTRTTYKTVTVAVPDGHGMLRKAKKQVPVTEVVTQAPPPRARQGRAYTRARKTSAY